MKLKDHKRRSFDGNHRILQAAISRNRTSQDLSNARFRDRKPAACGALECGLCDTLSCFLMENVGSPSH